MKQRRLTWLLAALTLLLILKVIDRRSIDPIEPVVPAVSRVQPVIARSPVVSAPGNVARQPSNGVSEAESESDEPRNAFALRAPPAPPPAPVAVAPNPGQTAKLLVGPPLPPPPPPEPPPPSYQVIGTWEDPAGTSVFIAGPSGMVQVRAGDILFAEYRVQQITATQVAILQLSTQREYRLSAVRTPTESR